MGRSTCSSKEAALPGNVAELSVGVFLLQVLRVAVMADRKSVKVHKDGGEALPGEVPVPVSDDDFPTLGKDPTSPKKPRVQEGEAVTFNMEALRGLFAEQAASIGEGWRVAIGDAVGALRSDFEAYRAEIRREVQQGVQRPRSRKNFRLSWNGWTSWRPGRRLQWSRRPGMPMISTTTPSSMGAGRGTQRGRTSCRKSPRHWTGLSWHRCAMRGPVRRVRGRAWRCILSTCDRVKPSWACGDACRCSPWA